MRNHISFQSLLFVLTLTVTALPTIADANIYQSILLEPNQATAEVSTDELKLILETKSAIVFDARPHEEFSVSHIPGAVNVAPKPGMPISLYTSDVAEVGRVLEQDKSRSIVLYCNGPFCGKSKRLAADLLKDGYKNVRRYQLGMPVWRALGGLAQIEEQAVLDVYLKDRTAVFIDGRSHQEYLHGRVRRSVNVPVSEVVAAKDDGRLPMNDHNTRIIVYGVDGAQARAVAGELAKNAFSNVTFYDGSAADVIELTSTLRRLGPLQGQP